MAERPSGKSDDDSESGLASGSAQGEDQQSDSSNGANGGATIPDEILEGVPEEQKKEMQSMFAAMAMQVPVPNPIAQKVTPELIGKAIDAASRDSKMEFDDRKDARRWASYGLWFVGVLVGLLLVFLVSEGEDALVKDLLQFGLGALGGFGGGYGFANRRRQ